MKPHEAAHVKNSRQRNKAIRSAHLGGRGLGHHAHAAWRHARGRLGSEALHHRRGENEYGGIGQSSGAAAADTPRRWVQWMRAWTSWRSCIGVDVSPQAASHAGAGRQGLRWPPLPHAPPWQPRRGKAPRRPPRRPLRTAEEQDEQRSERASERLTAASTPQSSRSSPPFPLISADQRVAVSAMMPIPATRGALLTTARGHPACRAGGLSAGGFNAWPLGVQNHYKP